MKVIKYPARESWKKFTKRPVNSKNGVKETVCDIIQNVQNNGDDALYHYTKKFDSVELDKLTVSDEKLKDAETEVDEDLKSAIKIAADNIRKFHRAQFPKEITVETAKGVTCRRKSVPIKKAGLYIPGGSAPLLSTVLMLGIPAQIAGCRQIVLCTPPQKSGSVHPSVLYSAGLLGIENIYKIGGVQAIAAMAYGTETISRVDKLFGPGNSFVTKAKELVQMDGIAIDMPAGPSEQLIIADESSNPAFMAADLLSQAEHGPDSQVILLSNSETVIEQILTEIKNQLDKLPRKEIAEKALQNSFAVLLKSLEKCTELSNYYAPEHLIVVTEQNDEIVSNITNAGSVFIGNYSPESAGDYASGTNHTLPTGGYAKNYSSLSVDSFMKTMTIQKISPEGLQQIGPAVEKMAGAEGLEAHKNAVTLRLKELNNG